MGISVLLSSRVPSISACKSRRSLSGAGHANEDTFTGKQVTIMLMRVKNHGVILVVIVMVAKQAR